MTNLDKAAAIIYGFHRDEVLADGFPCPEWDEVPTWQRNDWTYVAQALATAGLLTPEGSWYEYRAEFWDNRGDGIGPWRPVSRDMDTKGWADKDTAQDDREQAHADGLKTRLVRRTIGHPEVVADA